MVYAARLDPDGVFPSDLDSDSDESNSVTISEGAGFAGSEGVGTVGSLGNGVSGTGSTSSTTSAG